jgi:transcriptional regulator with PAS, ATPase and Fis domain
MEDLICRARKYAELDSTTVLILGETGTGKELFAHSIHNESPRAKGPFVAINCAALPENLLESELFGYAEGAFTGARRGGKIGLFEMAHMGTIFLDEIGDMPLNLQSRLLRVIQEKEVMRIGDDRVIPVDVRIIASTNRNLEEDIEKGAFRRDLFYRLNVLKLIIPPLRERKEDIPLLVDLFVEKYSARLGKKVRGITQKARDLLMNLDYPGNVRELKGIIERAVAFAESEYIEEADLGISNQAAKQSDAISRDIFKVNFTLKEIEIMAIKEALAKTQNNISGAARLLGVDRTTIWRKIKESGLMQ